jgi:hypothetical protein
VLYLKGQLTGKAENTQAEGSRESQVINSILEWTFSDLASVAEVMLPSVLLQHIRHPFNACYMAEAPEVLGALPLKTPRGSFKGRE